LSSNAEFKNKISLHFTLAHVFLWNGVESTGNDICREFLVIPQGFLVEYFLIWQFLLYRFSKDSSDIPQGLLRYFAGIPCGIP